MKGNPQQKTHEASWQIDEWILLKAGLS
jgi:hypothetical protein